MLCVIHSTTDSYQMFQYCLHMYMYLKIFKTCDETTAVRNTADVWLLVRCLSQKYHAPSITLSIGLENYSDHFKFYLYFQCPMYDKSTDEEAPGPSSNPVELMDDMRRDGLTFKQCVLGRKNNFTAENQV